MLRLLLAVLAQADAGSVLDHCRVVPEPLLDAGHQVILCDLPVYGPRFASTRDQRDAGNILHRWPNGDTLTMPAFLVGASQNGMPAIATMPGRVLEAYGWVEPRGGTHVWRSGVELYCFSLEDNGWVSGAAKNSCVSIGSGPSSKKVAWWMAEGSSWQGRGFTLLSDNNENYIRSASTRGPSAVSRLRLSGADPGAGTVVYVTADQFAGREIEFRAKGEVEVGKMHSAQAPSCTADAPGALYFATDLDCFMGCTGRGWRCLSPP